MGYCSAGSFVEFPVRDTGSQRVVERILQLPNIGARGAGSQVAVGRNVPWSTITGRPDAVNITSPSLNCALGKGSVVTKPAEFALRADGARRPLGASQPCGSPDNDARTEHAFFPRAPKLGKEWAATCAPRFGRRNDLSAGKNHAPAAATAISPRITQQANYPILAHSEKPLPPTQLGRVGLIARPKLD